MPSMRDISQTREFSVSLTESEISPSSRRVARPKKKHEPVLIRFVPGTRDRVYAVLVEGEDHASFVRAAVEAELTRARGG